jgi:hypothetical protein
MYKILLYKSFFVSLVIGMSFFYSGNALAQNIPFPDTIKVDSADAVHKGLFDAENRKTFKIMFSGKPARAGLYSLILPGGGQIYNKKYWKAPIVWGVVGYFGYVAVKSNIEYKDMDKVYRCMLKGESCTYTILNANNTETIISDEKVMRSYRDTKRNTTENNWVIFSVIYLIQVLEAYIDRHLIDFDLNPNLSFNSSITPDFKGLGLSYSLTHNKHLQKKLISY